MRRWMAMAFHFIAISSDYVKGQRIGWHYASEAKLDKGRIQNFMQEVEQRCGDTQLGIHKLSTDSTDFESVIEKDSFFEDVVTTKSEKYFIKQISSGKELSAYDVAKFILSIMPVSHLKLQKLLYYVYSEHLLETGKRLFKEPIVAFKYGPVIEDVFYKYRHHGSSAIDYGEDEVFFIHPAKTAITPSFARIISSEDGVFTAHCILETLLKYKEYSATSLVTKTHKKGGPWDRVYAEGMNQEITDEVIKEYHHIVQ
jgi:uncharacterized phage-associated protein